MDSNMMSVLDNLRNFTENHEGEQYLKKVLTSSKSIIWKNGLPEEGIDLIAEIFLEHPQITPGVKKLLLECMVPENKILDGTVRALLAWYFTNFSKDFVVSVALLRWLTVMLENNLIERKTIESLICQFMMCLTYNELVLPVCHLVNCLAKSGVITRRAVFIGQYFYDLPIMFRQKGLIGSFLRTFHEVSPSLLPNPPSVCRALKSYTDDFTKSVSSLAFQKGFSRAAPLKGKTVSANTKGRKKTKPLGNIKSFHGSELIGHVCNANSMKHLGLLIKKDQIPLQNLSSVIGCKEGQMYLSWKIISGGELPIDDFQSIISMAGNIYEVCQRTRSGLPVVSKALSVYLMSWDGEENADLIYNLISWVHFETFQELYTDVLGHIVNLFLTGTIRDQIRILNCLTDLIVNKVTRVSRDAIKKLMSLMEHIIKVVLAMQGFQSSALLLSCMRYYRYISCLEERYMLGTWTIPPPFLVFGAFFSDNVVLISEVCDLIIRHNTIMYPFFVSLGLIEDFKVEEEIIKTYLRDLYLLLWKGQACSTELVESEINNMPWISNDQLNPVFTIRNHYALKPLISNFSDHMGIEDNKRLSDKTLLKCFNSCLPGISSIKTVYEGQA